MSASLASPHTLIIGGTAAYGLDLAPYQPLPAGDPLETPYGLSPPIHFLQPDPARPAVAFCSRHGRHSLQHSAAFLNHRAIIWAAKMLGVSTILSWNGVGAIAPGLEVGELIVPHDLIDFSRSRISTFDNKDLIAATASAFHSQPRAAILAAAATAHRQGVYVCTEGPRLETVSEIQLYHRVGADIVGMTLSPEVFLAQEVAIAYASLCYITNYATGRVGERPPRRQFGPTVAHTCLPILLQAATILSKPFVSQP